MIDEPDPKGTDSSTFLMFPDRKASNICEEDRPQRIGVIVDGQRINEEWGDVLEDVNAEYRVGETVEVQFLGGHPKNNLQTQASYLEVQHLREGQWQTVAFDWDWNTEYHWQRLSNSRSGVRIVWRIPAATALGDYRIVHRGHGRRLGRVDAYEGVSSRFTVRAWVERR